MADGAVPGGRRGDASTVILRAYLTDSQNPLPHFRMKEPHVIATTAGKRRTISGKILIRRSDFDQSKQTNRSTPDLDRLVDEVVSEISR